jgi:pectate lyase
MTIRRLLEDPSSSARRRPRLPRPSVLLVLLVLWLVLIIELVFVVTRPPAAPASQAPPMAFPGAAGFGADTPGGRFGRTVFVTNLNDTLDINSPDYPGSFRWALNHPLPPDPADLYSQRRLIVFKVGGVIRLADVLVAAQPFTTIAAQTAPGDGIVLRGEGLNIGTHDVIVRGLRVRVGDEGSLSCCRRGISLNSSFTGQQIYNVVIDHSSVSWGIDENVETWTMPQGPAVQNITIQWSIISEGLNNSIHVDEQAPTPTTTDPHSMGMLLGNNNFNMSVHHNLFANNSGRNPSISGILNSEIVDNVVYGWQDNALEFSSDPNVTNVLNNYFKPNADSDNSEITLQSKPNPFTKIYLHGNVTEDRRVGPGLLPARLDNPWDFVFLTSPAFPSTRLKSEAAPVAYQSVLNWAGAISPARDSVDARIVEQVRQSTGHLIDSQNQVGGWPDYQGGSYPTDRDEDGIPDSWELAHGLDPANPGDASSSEHVGPGGYSWIEEYANSLIPPSP